MTRAIFALFAAVTSFTAQAEPNTEIHQEVDLQPVSILSDLSFEVTRNGFDAQDPMKSYVWISVMGSYEGNLCGGDRVVLAKTYTSTDYERPTFDVTIHKVALWQDRFQLDDYACLAFSRPTEFTAYVKLDITSWSGNQTTKTWVYTFKDARGYAKALTINFSTTEGWRVSN